MRHLTLSNQNHTGYGRFARNTFRMFSTSIFALLFVLSVFSAASVRAEDSQVRAVRLSYVEGNVQLAIGGDAASEPQFVDAHANAPLVEGSRLQTGEDGRAEIQFEDGSVARITPNSSISLNQLQRNASGAALTDMEVLSGLAYFEINNRGGEYTIRFGPNVITPSEATVFRVNLDASPAEVAVTRGMLHVDGGESNVADVKTNETARLDGASNGQPSIVESVTADSWDQWNSDRDKDLSELEASQTGARASSANPDDPGWNDLDYYGDWYDAPGYGMVWSPSGVDSGFDPYGSGYWGYNQGIGYSWISSYPWGWMPYHCGRWLFLGGGWAWAPQGCGYGFGGGWYPFTPVYYGPSGYRVPQRPIPVRAGKIPRQRALIPVTRAGSGTPIHWRPLGGPKPVSRTLAVNGVTVPPLAPTYHPRSTGPLGGGFSNGPRSGATPGPTGTGMRGSSGSTLGGRLPQEPARGGQANPPVYHPQPQQPSAPRYNPQPQQPSAPHYNPPPQQPSAPRYNPPPAPRYTPPPPPAPRSAPPPPPPPHVSAPSGGSNGGGARPRR